MKLQFFEKGILIYNQKLKERRQFPLIPYIFLCLHPKTYSGFQIKSLQGRCNHYQKNTPSIKVYLFLNHGMIVLLSSEPLETSKWVIIAVTKSCSRKLNSMNKNSTKLTMREKLIR